MLHCDLYVQLCPQIPVHFVNLCDLLEMRVLCLKHVEAQSIRSAWDPQLRRSTKVTWRQAKVVARDINTGELALRYNEKGQSLSAGDRRNGSFCCWVCRLDLYVLWSQSIFSGISWNLLIDVLSLTLSFLKSVAFTSMLRQLRQLPRYEKRYHHTKLVWDAEGSQTQKTNMNNRNVFIKNIHMTYTNISYRIKRMPLSAKLETS